MKRALIIHGMPSQSEYFNIGGASPSNSHWLPWLQHQLGIKGIVVQTPEMPVPYAPVYEAWLEVFEQFTIDKDTILVGHSCGGGFLLRWLSEHDVTVGRVVLVAPFLDPTKELPAHGLPDFFDFEIDPKVAAKTAGLTVYISDDEYHPEVVSSVAIIEEHVADITLKRLRGYGHFTRSSMGTPEFLHLLETLVD